MASKRKPGKYDHLFPKLKKLPPADLEYQQRVDETKKLLRRCASCDGTGKLKTPLSSADESHTCDFCDGTGRRKLTGKALSDLYVIARSDKETLEHMAREANLELEAISQMLVASQEVGDSDWGAFGASERAIKLTNGDSIRVQPEVFAMPRNKNDFREWCYTHGLRSKMELPDKATSDLVKLRLLNGESEPSGIEVYVRTRIVYTPMKMEVTSSSPGGDEQSNAVDSAEVF